MSRQTEIVRRWIDSVPEGAVIRSQDLEHLANRTQASRELIRLAKAGRLMRVACTLLWRPAVSALFRRQSIR